MSCSYLPARFIDPQGQAGVLLSDGNNVSIGSVNLSSISGQLANSSLAAMAPQTFKANATNSPNAPQDLTRAQAKSLLGITAADVSGLGSFATANSVPAIAITGVLPASQCGNLSGQVTSASGITTIANNVVTNAMLFPVPNFTLKGNDLAVAGPVKDLGLLNVVNAMLDQGVGNPTGNTIYRDLSNWKALPIGTSGQVMTVSAGPVLRPSWVDLPASSGVNNVRASASAAVSALGSDGTILLSSGVLQTVTLNLAVPVGQKLTLINNLAIVKAIDAATRYVNSAGVLSAIIFPSSVMELQFFSGTWYQTKQTPGNLSQFYYIGGNATPVPANVRTFIPFPNKRYDTWNDAPNGLFTCKVGGIYQFNVSIVGTSVTFELAHSTPNSSPAQYQTQGSYMIFTSSSFTAIREIFMLPGDTVGVYATSSSATQAGNNNVLLNIFTGRLIQPL